MAKNEQDITIPVIEIDPTTDVILPSESESKGAIGTARFWDFAQTTWQDIKSFRPTHDQVHFGGIMGFGTIAMGAMVVGPATGHPEAMLLSLGFLPASAHWAVCYSREQAKTVYGEVKFDWRKQIFVPKNTSPK